jgi:hypothetical protein
VPSLRRTLWKRFSMEGILPILPCVNSGMIYPRTGLSSANASVFLALASHKVEAFQLKNCWRPSIPSRKIRCPLESLKRSHGKVEVLGSVMRFHTLHAHPSVSASCDCWNSIAVMFELHCSWFELFCSELQANNRTRWAELSPVRSRRSMRSEQQLVSLWFA